MGNGLVAGLVAEIFGPADRGGPMALFTFATFVGQAIGGSAFGWVVQELGFQWVYGVGSRVQRVIKAEHQIQGIATGLACVGNLLFLRETRSDILLSRRARAMTESTGIKYIARGQEVKKGGVIAVLAVSCLRPVSECRGACAGIQTDR